MNVLRRTIFTGVVTCATVLALPTHASPLEICNAMRQAIAPGSGATLTAEQSLSAGNVVVKTFQLATPVTIGTARVEALMEFGGAVRAAFRFPDERAANEFGLALAKQYGQSQTNQSSARTVFRVTLPEPFVNASTTVRGRNVQFYCSVESGGRAKR